MTEANLGLAINLKMARVPAFPSYDAKIANLSPVLGEILILTSVPMLVFPPVQDLLPASESTLTNQSESNLLHLPTLFELI